MTRTNPPYAKHHATARIHTQLILDAAADLVSLPRMCEADAGLADDIVEYLAGRHWSAIRPEGGKAQTAQLSMREHPPPYMRNNWFIVVWVDVDALRLQDDVVRPNLGLQHLHPCRIARSAEQELVALADETRPLLGDPLENLNAHTDPLITRRPA